MKRYAALPCNCGHRSCKHWHVSTVADVHGVSFTKEQAELVSAVLIVADMPEYRKRINDLILQIAVELGYGIQHNEAIDQLARAANSRG